MTVPVTVGIPTYARGQRVLFVLEKVLACDPPPAEVIVHVDASDGGLERDIAMRFPSVRVLSSPRRVGPGGGRHRCIAAARQPLFVSFDDDSYPIDTDFFAEMEDLFAVHSRVAVIAAIITHPWETLRPRSAAESVVVDFTGCGHGLRIDAYRTVSGYVDLPNAYGMEETDLALQLHAAGWVILQSERVRVFHDTQQTHHRRAEIIACNIQNTVLLSFLRYPWPLWPRGLAQFVNRLVDTFLRHQFFGMTGGLLGIPGILWRHRHARRTLGAAAVRSYLGKRPRSAGRQPLRLLGRRGRSNDLARPTQEPGNHS